jgi:hypothetical protein
MADNVKAAIDAAVKANQKEFERLDVMLKAYEKVFGNRLIRVPADLGTVLVPKSVPRSAKRAAARFKAKMKAKATNGVHTPGKRGRKPGFSPEQVSKIQEEHKGGAPVLKLAKAYKVTPPTIYRALAQ